MSSISSITQDKNGDLQLDPEDVPSNVPATKEEKQEVFIHMADFMSGIGEMLEGLSDE